MKPYPQSLRASSYSVICFAVLFLLSLPVLAQIELSVELGFEGKLTPGHYAPIRIEVRNYHELGTSRFHIVQPVGNAWRGEAVIQQELGFAVQSDGIYDAVIPIYDPVNPIVIELLSSVDTVLAAQTLDSRGAMRPTTYPVLDKKIARFDDRAAAVDIASLPTQWWAFDSAESLWIASPLPNGTWAAIAQWVLAGGSLVLLTGTDFYRMESPILDKLIPLSNPVVAMSDGGTAYLTGTAADATVALLSEEGFPLLMHTSYGAGHVALVTVQAQSLSVDSLVSIAEHVPDSSLISLRDSTEQILGDQTIATLNSIFVLAITIILALTVSVSAVIGRRKPQYGWSVCLVVVTVGLVLSGFISNPANLDIDLYAIHCSVYGHDQFSFYIGSSSFYSRTSSACIQSHGEDVIPSQFIPRTIRGTDSYDLSTSLGYSRMRISPSQMRHWQAYGVAPSMLDVRQVADSTIRVNNYCPFDFDIGWVVIDGMVHSLPRLYSGIHDYEFAPDSAVRLAAFVSYVYSSERKAELLLIQELQESFPLTKGIWLLAIANDERIVSDNIAAKVRDITLAVVRGQEVDLEI